MKKALTIVTTETDPYKQLGWYDFNLFDGQKLDIIFVVNVKKVLLRKQTF